MDYSRLQYFTKRQINSLVDKLVPTIFDNYENAYPNDQNVVETLLKSYTVNEELLSKYLIKQFGIIKKDYGGCADVLYDVGLLLSSTRISNTYLEDIINSI